MKPDHPPSIDRLYDLLALETIEGLKPAERGELRTLLAKWPHVAPDDLELAAALVEAAANGPPLEPLSDSLAAAVESRAAEYFRPARPKRIFSRARFAYAGWIVAACLTLGITIRIRQTVSEPVEPTVADRRLELLNAGAGRFEAPPHSAVRGDVVWDAATQRGYLKIRGLPANDPNRTQYQLWIVDRGRSHKEPVDGGVFDVAADGEIVVAIRPPLTVREPVLFAVTEETAGGVVVSERGRRGDFALVMAPVGP